MFTRALTGLSLTADVPYDLPTQFDIAASNYDANRPVGWSAGNLVH